MVYRQVVSCISCNLLRREDLNLRLRIMSPACCQLHYRARLDLLKPQTSDVLKSLRSLWGRVVFPIVKAIVFRCEFDYAHFFSKRNCFYAIWIYDRVWGIYSAAEHFVFSHWLVVLIAWFLIFKAALISLWWCVPHSGQSHCLSFKDNSLFTKPQQLQVFELGKNLSTLTTCPPFHFDLYSNCRLNSCGEWFSIFLFSPDLRFFAILLIAFPVFAFFRLHAAAHAFYV